jgi:hypothetical protein
MKTARSPLRLRLTCTAVLALALVGCAGRYGSIRWDNSVERVFSAAQVLPGHRYYTTGSDTAPDAILALHNDRPLRSDLWREVPMTAEKLARLVDRMRGTRDDSPYGSVVLDETGTRIGVWCSYQRPLPVKLLDDGGVIVAPPLGETGEAPWFSGFGID